MARKGENIYRRKDGRWEGRFFQCNKSDGRAKYASVYGHSYSEAKKKLQQKRAEVLFAMPKPAEDLTVNTESLEVAAQRWLRHTRPKIKESTYSKYLYLWEKHIKPELGSQSLRSVDAQEIEGFVAAKLTRGRSDGKGGLSQKTVADILSVLKLILKSAKVAIVDFPKAKTKTSPAEMPVLHPLEQETLTKNLLSDMDLSKAGVLLCLSTGIRVGELCALRWEDLDLDEKILRVRGTMQRVQDRDADAISKTKILISTPKSQCSLREIPLPDRVLEILRRFENKNKQAFFLSGKQYGLVEPRKIQYVFQKYLREAGVAHVPYHALRHTFASQCIAQGMDAKCLSQLLGHSNVNIALNRYVHTTMEQRRAQMARVEFF